MADEHSINLQPGTVLGGKYEVVKSLGAGSMGVVYACRHRMLQGQLFAVKVLYPEVAQDKVASARFENEVLASHRVSHANVVRAYDYFIERDLIFYTMEYVGGGDLAEKLNAPEGLSIQEILKLLSQMAAGCQAIHDAGIVHRDLKPENILLTTDGQVKIADFGIARNRHGPKLTEHGGVVGTIDYVAPEYMLKSQVDWRSDIYALGILAYEMLTGVSPFKGDNLYATMMMRLKTDPEPPSALRPDCPAELDRIILKAMQREPDNRYQTALEMFGDLRKLCNAMGISLADPGSAGKSVVIPPGPTQRGPSIVLDAAEAAGIRDFIATAESVELRRQTKFEPASGVPGGISEGDSPEWVGGDGLGSQYVGTISLRSDKLAEQERHGADGMKPSFRDYSVGFDDHAHSPYGTPEPSVPSFASRPDRRAKTPSQKAPLPFRAGRMQESQSSSRHLNQGDTRTGEFVAMLFAAAVGIGFGFLFLKLFAPALLKHWSL